MLLPSASIVVTAGMALMLASSRSISSVGGAGQQQDDKAARALHGQVPVDQHASAQTVGTCSLMAKYWVMSSAISPETSGTWPM